MSDPAYPIQLGIASALLAAPAVTALVGQAIYDPASAAGKAYPFVEIGEDQIVPNADAITDLAWVTIHIWADGPTGRFLAKQIAGAIRDVLAPRPPATSALTVAGYSVISGLLHSARYLNDTDDTDPSVIIAHGNLSLRFQLAPTA